MWNCPGLHVNRAIARLPTLTHTLCNNNHSEYNTAHRTNWIQLASVTRHLSRISCCAIGFFPLRKCDLFPSCFSANSLCSTARRGWRRRQEFEERTQHITVPCSLCVCVYVCVCRYCKCVHYNCQYCRVNRSKHTITSQQTNRINNFSSYNKRPQQLVQSNMRIYVCAVCMNNELCKLSTCDAAQYECARVSVWVWNVHLQLNDICTVWHMNPDPRSVRFWFDYIQGTQENGVMYGIAMDEHTTTYKPWQKINGTALITV